MKILPDSQIIDLYFARDERAITETDRAYGSRLFRVSYNILGDRLDCEECRNDTYAAAWNSMPPTRPAVLPAFLTEIIRRISINRYKEKSRAKRIPSALTLSLEENEHEIPDTNSNSEDIGALIGEYLKTLTEERRYIFIERFYMSESVEKIAREAEMSAPTVYRAINTMRSDLRLYLKENGVFI